MKYLITLTFVAVAVLGNAQDHIEYDYDDAGNRIERRLILSTSEPEKDNDNNKNSDQYADNDNKETNEYNTTSKKLRENDLDGASLYPNPTNSFVDVDLGALYNSDIAQSLEIIDFNGKVVQRLDINSKRSRLKMSGYRSGMYYVHLKNEAVLQESWKVVKIN